MALSYDEIAEILKIIDGSSCDELVVDTGDMKLVVRRNSVGGAYVPQDNAPAVAAPPPPAAQPMKLVTTIASEHDGRIAAIGAENGELVEYGRTLFVIEPA